MVDNISDFAQLTSEISCHVAHVELAFLASLRGNATSSASRALCSPLQQN